MSSLSNYDNIDFFCSSDNSDETILSEFINKYKPIYYINDKINADDFKFPISKYNLNIFYFLHYNICQYFRHIFYLDVYKHH